MAAPRYMFCATGLCTTLRLALSAGWDAGSESRIRLQVLWEPVVLARLSTMRSRRSVQQRIFGASVKLWCTLFLQPQTALRLLSRLPTLPFDLCTHGWSK